MSVEENKRKVEKFFGFLSTGNIAGFADMYHADGSVWTAGKTLISGTSKKANILESAGAIYDAFPNGITFTIFDMVAEGNKVAVEAESSGTHVSGLHYNNTYHFLFEFKDGQVLKLKEYMDTEMITDVLCGGQRPE